MKTMAKIVWTAIMIIAAVFAAIVPFTALVGSILIPMNVWGWAYNHALILGTIIGFLGFISWGFTWIGLIYLVVNKLQGR